MFDPATMPPVDGCIRRGVFLSHVHRRPVDITFRGVAHKAAQTDPSLGRKASQAGFTQEVTDLEIMFAPSVGTARPQANSTDQIRVYDAQIGATARTYTDYRITNVQQSDATGCYFLTLAKRNL